MSGPPREARAPAGALRDPGRRATFVPSSRPTDSDPRCTRLARIGAESGLEAAAKPGAPRAPHDAAWRERSHQSASKGRKRAAPALLFISGVDFALTVRALRTSPAP